MFHQKMMVNRPYHVYNAHMVEKLTGDSEYFRNQVYSAEELLADGQYEQVSLDILTCYNNMRGGWTAEVDALFTDPQTPEEQHFADRMGDVIVQTVGGLLEEAEPGTGLFEYGLLEHLAVQLYRLGDRAPRKMIDATRWMLKESHAMGAPETMIISTPALELLSSLDAGKVRK